MKQTIIHDRSTIPEHIRGHFRNSIEYPRSHQQNLIRHKKYKANQGSSKHRSIYSLAMESSKMLNDFDLSSKIAQSLHPSEQDERPREQRTYDSGVMNISRDIRLQRYSRNDRKQRKYEQSEEGLEGEKQNRQKIGLLKRIIQHYNIKSYESSYYSNLMNNLGIKVTGGSQLKTRFTNLKPNSIKFHKDDVKTMKHERSLKVKHHSNVHSVDCDDFFNNSIMKIEAQSINHLLKYDAEEERSAIKAGINQIKDEKLKTTNNLRKTNHQMYRGNKKQLFRHENLTSLKFYDNGQNCLSVKINKYKQFIYIINFSNNNYRELDIQRYDTAFKIFIGSGNNSNLIRGIMKKRFWFQVTKNKEQAHFVWTQLKNEDIFVKQRQSYKSKCENRNCFQFNRMQSKMEVEQQTYSSAIQNSQQPIIDLVDRPKNEQSPKNETKTKASSKNVDFFNPYSKVMTNQQANIYMEMMADINYKKKSKFNYRMKYLKFHKYISEQQFSFEILQNHLPLNGLLGNKKAMFYIMKEYCRLSKKNIFQIVPLTFHIKKGLMDEQFKQFMAIYNENKTSKRQNYWIMKPGEFSNRGQGISCTSKAEAVRAKINSLKKLGKNKSLILQQYITNPLLYNGRKFDIRTYMMVALNNGKLRAYWYQDGYVRTSSYLWRLDDFEDTLIHLTNDAIQKHSDNYGKFQPANKLTYSELQRYLDTLPKIGNTKNNFQNEIYPKLKEIATDAIRASYQFLQTDRRVNNFQIFGFDFMIDSNFKPWLIEINTNPCLEVNCLALERIIPSLIENAFRIGLDPLFPPPMNYSSTHKYNIPENALHYNRFELIFDEERDGEELVELYRGSQVVESIDDYEEDKEVYQEEGEEMNLQEN